MIKSELLDGFEAKVEGKIKLQPFFGESIEVDWVRVQIAPSTEEPNDEYNFITVDCAVVSQSNENMILTSDILARLKLRERSNNVVSCNTVDAPSCVSDTEIKTLLPGSDDTVNNDDTVPDVIDGVLSDDVGDNNESDVGITHSESELMTLLPFSRLLKSSRVVTLLKVTLNLPRQARRDLMMMMMMMM